MAESLSVLAQDSPAMGSLTDLYTVPTAASVALSRVLATNRGDQATTVRVAIAVDGAADEAKQYVYYDMPVPAKRTVSLGVGATLGGDDVLRVWSGNGLVSFNAFGVLVT